MFLEEREEGDHEVDGHVLVVGADVPEVLVPVAGEDHFLQYQSSLSDTMLFCLFENICYNFIHI